jgi:hypothetical protein
MKPLVSLLVGARFRPPAELLLANLPAGAKLLLEPDEENPYDPAAVRVLVSPSQIPEGRHEDLRDALPGYGRDLEEVLAEDWLWLGFVAASGGKPLQIARERGEATGLVGNKEFGEAMLEPFEAELTFSVAGSPLVILKPSQ